MTNLILAALGGVCLGLAVALILSRVFRKNISEARLRSVTRRLFITTQWAAILWVSCSYLIAGYSTIRLGEPFPVTELSKQAITAILGVNVMKVVENIFEHNEGVVFGKCKSTTKTTGGSSDRDY